MIISFFIPFDTWIMCKLYRNFFYQKVPPAELEALLLTHPGVMDCAVIGLPNEDVGELPLAFVVPSLKNKPSKKELIDFVAGI